jgi:hypothetical protein
MYRSHTLTQEMNGNVIKITWPTPCQKLWRYGPGPPYYTLALAGTYISSLPSIQRRLSARLYALYKQSRDPFQMLGSILMHFHFILMVSFKRILNLFWKCSKSKPTWTLAQSRSSTKYCNRCWSWKLMLGFKSTGFTQTESNYHK